MTEIMSCVGLVACNWRPVHRQSSLQPRKGAGQVLRYSDPFWEVDLTYGVAEADFRILSAQFSRLDGAVGQMEIWRLNRKRPLAIPGANASTVTAFSISGDEVTLTTAGGALGLGEMLSYTALTGRQYVGELMEITGGSGNTVTGKCFPPVVPPAASPAALVYQAFGLFRQVPESFSPVEPVGTSTGGLSVTMRQVEP